MGVNRSAWAPTGRMDNLFLYIELGEWGRVGKGKKLLANINNNSLRTAFFFVIMLMLTYAQEHIGN